MFERGRPAHSFAIWAFAIWQASNTLDPSLNDKPLERLRHALVTLRANGFTTLREAVVFSAAAAATANDEPASVERISRVAKEPYSTVSRILEDLAARGLVEFRPHPRDARVKVVKANLSVLK